MRAAVLTEPGRIDIEERDRPDPAPEEALVAVERVGICGSDLHYYQHGRIGEYVVDFALPLSETAAAFEQAADPTVVKGVIEVR